MVFGEIVEPSTRALIDDEFEDYPEYVKCPIIWEGDCKVPSTLNTLIFIEGNKITKLFDSLILKSQVLYCTLKSGGLQIYKVTNDTYVVSYVKKDMATGEIVEELLDWLKKATNIYMMISEPVSTYQNFTLSEKPETLIRTLSSKSNGNVFNYKKLESPNLVSGLGADVLSYSIHTGLNSTLFVVYMDNSPFDSVNINPVVKLMQTLNLPVNVKASNLNPVASNLYL